MEGSKTVSGEGLNDPLITEGLHVQTSLNHTPNTETTEGEIVLDALVECKERVLEFIHPLKIIMKKDPENQKMFVFKEESLGIDVFSPTFDGLKNEIKECLFFLWDTYAKECDSNLSEDAIELKNVLLKKVREVQIKVASDGCKFDLVPGPRAEPLKDVRSISGTWPDQEDDGFEAAIDKHRHQDGQISKALKIANNCLYFDDSADYGSALFEVCLALGMSKETIGERYIED